MPPIVDVECLRLSGAGRHHRAAVPIATLDPGVYLLTFEASVGTSSARREVRFVVQ